MGWGFVGKRFDYLWEGDAPSTGLYPRSSWACPQMIHALFSFIYLGLGGSGGRKERSRGINTPSYPYQLMGMSVG